VSFYVPHNVAVLLPELPSTPRTNFYTDEVLAAGLETFDREGLWLLLSLHHYGWRAHADMVSFLLGEADPLGLGEHHAEHRAMAALEELFLLLDQMWRLISGIQSHREGEGFLAGYRRHGSNVAEELEALRAMSAEDWREIFGIPANDEELAAILEARGAGEELDSARELRDDVLETTVRNMEEIAVFFVRTDPVAGEQGRSLRDINNAYRHGTQVVYEDTAPEEIPWRAANPEEAQGLLVAAAEVNHLAREETVSVLLEAPDEEGHARFASMPRSAEVNASLIDSMKNLSILMWRIATSFLVVELQGGPVLSAFAPFSWAEVDERFRAEEAASP
jgi:hypothetical protein